MSTALGPGLKRTEEDRGGLGLTPALLGYVVSPRGVVICAGGRSHDVAILSDHSSEKPTRDSFGVCVCVCVTVNNEANEKYSPQVLR